MYRKKKPEKETWKESSIKYERIIVIILSNAIVTLKFLNNERLYFFVIIIFLTSKKLIYIYLQPESDTAVKNLIRKNYYCLPACLYLIREPEFPTHVIPDARSKTIFSSLAKKSN